MSAFDTPTVLIVDDNRPTARILEATVKGLGYRAIIAVDGETALELVEEEPLAGALLDLILPGMDGLEVCRRLRAHPRTAAVPILLVTATEDLNSRLAGFEAGADDFVTKPFNRRELAARLRAHVELAVMRRQVAELHGALATIRLISHEFNNPLTMVLGGMDLLQMTRSGDGSNEEEALSMIGDGTSRLGELARRLVSISDPCFKESPIGAMLDIEASR